MSNVYIQEPPTSGKVLLKTSVGDIDLELWAKETPKACRNFVQLCLEGYYNNTIFHRVVKGFIIQGGDPTGTGTGGESVYGQPFKDEFHSRLRFNRRGLLAMANAGRDDNGSQFFFTLGASPELQNKHTIFGKVTGETIYNMLKLEDALVDKDEKPIYPQKIIKIEVLYNPFPDIIPRILPEDVTIKEVKQKKDKRSGVKNFKLLSFGEEAEEDEEEAVEANKKYSGRSKSTHDLLNDPKLSAMPAVSTVEMSVSGKRNIKETEEKRDGDRKKDHDKKQDLIGKHKKDGVEEKWEEEKKRGSSEKRAISSQSEGSDSGLSGDEVSHRTGHTPEKDVENMDRIRKKLKSDREHKSIESEREEEYTLGKDKRDERQKKTKTIRKEIRELKRELQSDKKTQDPQENVEQSNEISHNESTQEYKQDKKKYELMKSQIPLRGSSRQDFTLALLAKFQKKLACAKQKVEENSEAEVSVQESATSTGSDDENWLTHKLHFESNTPVLAKDASTKNDDWFEIYDPRNPINKRRREASKDAMRQKERR